MAPQAHSPEIQSALSVLHRLRIPQLKTLLRGEALLLSGVKQSLQSRLIGRLHFYADNGPYPDQAKLNHFIACIHAVANDEPPPPPPPIQPQPSHQQHILPARTAFQGSPASIPPPPIPLPQMGRLTFKKSPFYTILEPLTSTIECKVREQSRDSITLKVILDSNTVARLLSMPNLRVMVYCAADTSLNQYSASDIAFPLQVELKVNLDDVKANLRGLKNKPGTTRPADITPLIRKKAGFSNIVSMNYALTQKKFFVVVNLVQKHTVEELVTQLQVRKTISSEQVVKEMQARAQDTDIEATSANMSLKCPLSTLRISVPCRTSLCTHNQCFDASSFLQLQEQAPTWSCPICYKSTSFEALQIDQYFDNILRATAPSVEQVTIEPNGDWTDPSATLDSSTPLANGALPNGQYDDEDLVEINGLGVPSVKREAESQISLHATPTPSREASSVASATRPSTGKRTISQVIDLTASDEDEDEEPPRSAKRLAFALPNGNHGSAFDPLSISASTTSTSPVPRSYHYDR